MKKILLAMMLLAPMSMLAQQKFGYIETQKIMESMPEFIKARGDLEAQQKQYENDIKAMQDEFKRKYDDYEKQKSTMNATKQKETEESLQQMSNKISDTYADYQKKMQQMQQEKLSPLQTKMINAINSVGKAGGYVYIMEAGTVVYMSETLCENVTEKVISEIRKLK